MVTTEQIKVQKEARLFADLGKRRVALDLLMSYDVRYLTVGLEVLYERVFNNPTKEYLEKFLTEVRIRFCVVSSSRGYCSTPTSLRSLMDSVKVYSLPIQRNRLHLIL